MSGQRCSTPRCALPYAHQGPHAFPTDAENARLRAEVAGWRKGVEDANRLTQREALRADMAEERVRDLAAALARTEHALHEAEHALHVVRTHLAQATS